jgi:glycerol-3-phosphate dehydrogenase
VRTRFAGAVRDGGLWRALLAGPSGEEEVAARAIVNAGGPWVADVLRETDAKPANARVRHVKGSHIVVPRVHAEEHAYILQNSDKRIVFVIPYQEHYSLIGTTDVAVDEYDAPRISADEVDYLIELANAYLATPLARSDVVWTYSGVRPLYDDGASDPSSITRDYVLKLDALDGPPGPDRAPVLSIYGGKITTYRKLAEAALAELAPYFPATKPAWTASEALPGGDLPRGDRAALLASLCSRYPSVPVDVLRPLARRHGTLAFEVLGDARTLDDLGESFGAGLTAREIDYLVEREWAQEPDDVLWRRTKCGLPMTATQRSRAGAYVRSAASR